MFEDLKFSELASSINLAVPRGASSGAGLLAPEKLPNYFEKFRNIPAEDRTRIKTATKDERASILKKAGFTDPEIKQMKEMRKKRAERGR